MSKGKQRHKDRGRYTKSIVISGFANDKHLELYKYVLDKYLSGQVDPLLDVLTDDLDDHEAIKVLEIEDYGVDIRVKDDG